MDRTFFISDAHLGVGDKKIEDNREKILLDFLEYVEKKAKRLYIVGDLFDFWFEYSSVIPRQYFRILLALKKLVDQGVKVVYITGNHDFWMEDFLEDELGIQIYRRPIECEIEGKLFYVAHGDGIMKKDVGYRILKKVLQCPLNIRLYRLLHPDFGFGLAKFFSKLSRNHIAFKNKDEEYLQYARNRFNQGFDFVVLAHTHSPQIFKEDKRIYINTGDWMNCFTYGKYERGRLSLEYWSNKKGCQ